jgi:hypothetical protein
MITVFLLMLMTGPDRQVSSTNMIFMDLQQCNFYAARLVKSYTNNGGSAEQIMTRCIPRQAKIVLQ